MTADIIQFVVAAVQIHRDDDGVWARVDEELPRIRRLLFADQA